MKSPFMMWRTDMEPLGDAVVAVGVFDGVHIGHQTLLGRVVEDAARLDATSVALTFDRDPDQVITPSSAAPQLLTLDDKCRFISECGIDAVLVVPFTATIAATPAEEFLDDVLHCSARVRAIHVGEDFRFGARAAGDTRTLSAWADGHGASVVAHKLTSFRDSPVTSTRIRALVAQGDVTDAARLLGRPTRVVGAVHEGRKLGQKLGFPTANLSPDAFAAVPADGVYAGRAVLEDWTVWPAAISVGTPPTFPQAREYVEAHLIGYAGDLYGERLTLEFVERLRPNRSFDSAAELTDAIRADVAKVAALIAVSQPATAHVRRSEVHPLTVPAIGASQTPIARDERADYGDEVEDPAALEAAERAVAQLDHDEPYGDFDESWVEVLGPVTLVNVSAAMRAFEITGPLADESIPFVWDPMPPGSLTSVRPELAQAQRFHLFVPPEHARRARELVSWWEGTDAEE